MCRQFSAFLSPHNSIMTYRPAFYSQNENQNYFVPEGRTSSRVMQAPGGTSSINLCWDNPKDNGETIDNYTYSAVIVNLHHFFNSTCYVLLTSPSRFLLPLDVVGQLPATKSESIKVSNNSFANGNNMNCGNVLTERPSSRVIHPPGGKSTICLS